MADKTDYRQILTDKLIEHLEAGTAPWQKPWDAREGSDRLPYNPVTGKEYRGANSLFLTMNGRSDPRWATYKQAAEQGWQVRKGEKSSLIEYWKFSDSVPAVDVSGKPIMGDDGKQKTTSVLLEKPKVFRARVFNAEQMDGVPELSKAPRQYEWDPVDRADAILKSSGAKLFHDQADRAFYSPSRDEIHLPGRDQFKDQAAYYSTALHELGHWTGHETRLRREFGGGFGSAEYAKEELRAELSSYFMADKLGIPHDPGQHAAYVKSWIQVLQEDKNEIFRAARDAEKIVEYVSGLAQEQGISQSNDLFNKPAHELTLAQFSLIAKVTALENHGRKYEVSGFGEHAFSDAATPDEAVRDVHRAMVNNALYWNERGLDKDVPSSEQMTVSMPPSEVVAEYPQLREKFPRLFEKNQTHLFNFKEEIAMAESSLDYSAMLTPEAVKHMGDSVVAAIFEGHDQVRIDSDGIISKFSDTLTPQQYRGFNQGEAEKTLFSALAEIKKEHGLLDNPYEKSIDFFVANGGTEQDGRDELNYVMARSSPQAISAELVQRGFAEPSVAEKLGADLLEYAEAMPPEELLAEQYASDIRVGRRAEIFSEGYATSLFFDKERGVVELNTTLRSDEFASLADVNSFLKRPYLSKEVRMALQVFAQQAQLPQTDPLKTTLAVPFKDKEEAKALGAKWDKDAKIWFAPPGADLAKLDKWLVKPEISSVPLANPPEVDFALSLKENGLVLDGLPIMDGKIHRVPVEGKGARSRDGAYVGYLDGNPSGFIQNFSAGTKSTWTQSGVSLSPEERAQMQAHVQLMKEQREAELATLNASVAEKCVEKWERLNSVSRDGNDNEYLSRKGVMAFNVRQDDGKLVVPMRDIDGKLWSLQTISATEGAPKLFEKGGLKKGNFSIFSVDPKARDGGAANFDALASHKPSQPILVAEGYATAATIGEATKETVVVAFDSGNIDPVVESLRNRFPMAPIFICADDDRHQANNVGVEKAWESAEKHQVGIVVPEFSDGQKGTDFNDLAAAHGADGKGAVAAQIKPHIQGSMRKSREVVASKMGFPMQPVKTCSKPVCKDRGVER